MRNWGLTVGLLALVFACSVESYQQDWLAGAPVVLRSKRQQCRCVRLDYANNVQCSCPQATATAAPDATSQKDELATELSQSYPAAKCACIQIVFAGTPQYQCHCGESGTVTVPTETPGNGQCHCIMITITGPASAQYQCSCLSTPATPAAEPPMTTQAAITYPPQTAIPDTLPPATQPSTALPTVIPTFSTETLPPLTSTIQTTQPTTTAAPTPAQDVITTAPTYPLTTTCVMYLTGVQSSPCTCMPEYDPCAPNICCLKAKFRSLKHSKLAASLPIHPQQPSQEDQSSTIDVLMNVLQKIKTKWQSS
ncbi:unnamed protein product, partial [Mesorhabditis spiculigera]